MGIPPPNCSDTVHSSLLRGPGAPFRRVIAAAFVPPSGMGSLRYCLRLMAEAGVRSPEDMRDFAALPRVRLLCRELAEDEPDPETLPPLEAAVILGLCSGGLFDPSRPVILTETRLERRVELFTVADFYGVKPDTHPRGPRRSHR